MIIEFCTTTEEERNLLHTAFLQCEKYYLVPVLSRSQKFYFGIWFILLHPVRFLALLFICLSCEGFHSFKAQSLLRGVLTCNAQYMKAEHYPYAVIGSGYLQVLRGLGAKKSSANTIMKLMRYVPRSDHYIFSDSFESTPFFIETSLEHSLAPATIDKFTGQTNVKEMVERYSSPKFIRYITFARMPTEKAHGLQIAKMCEAFTKQNVFISLVTPRRANHIDQAVTDYYSLESPLQYWLAPVFDVTGRVKNMNSIHHYLHEFLFAWQVLWMRIPKEVIVYTRSPLVVFVGSLRARRVIIEQHYWPTSGSWLMKRLLAPAMLIVCNSEGAEKECVRHGLSQAFVAHNGFDDSLLQETITNQAAKTKLGLDTDKKVVMYIGSLGDWKGVDTLAEAATNFAEDCVAVVIGGSDHELPAWKEKYPHVIFLGRRPYEGIGQFQRAADILVVPNNPITKESLEYTSPIKLFAHMASGIPLLVSDLPALKSIVGEEEATFFTPGDPASLVSAVATLLDNYPAALQKSAHTKEVATKFTWSNRAALILNRLDAH